MKKKIVCIGACLLSSAMLFGCKADQTNLTPTGTSAEEESTSYVVDIGAYEYTEKSKTHVTFSDRSEEVIDISDCVTDYTFGDIYMNVDGVKKTFQAEVLTPTDEEKELFEEYEKEKEFEGEVGELMKVKNDEHTILIRVGSTFSMVDKDIRTLSLIPFTREGKTYIPFMDMAFAFGYEGITTSISNDVVTYLLHTPTDEDMFPNPDAMVEFGEPVEGVTVEDLSVEGETEAATDEAETEVETEVASEPVSEAASEASTEATTAPAELPAETETPAVINETPVAQ